MTPAAARGHAAAPFAPRDHAIGQGARHASRVRNAGLNGVTSDIYAVFFDIPRALCDATLAMQRDAISDLRAWATAPDRRPLVLRGARQVGKTWLVETFAREHIGDVATVNLERHASMHEVFAKPSPRDNANCKSPTPNCGAIADVGRGGWVGIVACHSNLHENSGRELPCSRGGLRNTRQSAD